MLLKYHVTDIEIFVFFDSLKDDLSFDLPRILQSYASYIVDFVSFRNVFRLKAIDMIKELNFEIIDDADTLCYYLPKDEALKFGPQLPPKIHLNSLNECHVEKINSLWPHRYPGSETFVSYSIKNHLSLGLFNDGGELLAWCLRYPTGGLGILQVDEKHLRKGFGGLITKSMARKIIEEYDIEVTALIAKTNVKSLNMFTSLGFKAIDRHSWLVLKMK